MRFRQNCECGPAAMKAVTSALASGAITPGEAERIAAVVGTFVWSIETSDFERRLKDAEDGLTRHLRSPAGASGVWASGRYNP
jgi:hypothetical protein